MAHRLAKVGALCFVNVCEITYRQLAEISGRDLRAVQAVCKGKYSYGIDTLIDIAQAVGAEVKF